MIIDFLLVRLDFSKHQCAVGAAHAGGVAQDDVDGGVNCLASDIEVFGFGNYIFKIDIRGNKRVLHHKDGINGLACPCHPILMSGHGFGGGDERPRKTRRTSLTR